VVVNGPDAVNITRDTVSEGIEVTTDAAIVVRDPRRHLTWIVLPETIFAYDERKGRWEKGAGGLHPQAFPTEMRPTAAAIWRGELVIGCADGHLRRIDDAATSDDGSPIQAFVTMPVLRGDGGGDLVACNVRPVLSRKSGPTLVRVFGARTAEDVLEPAYRKPLMTMMVGPYRNDPHCAAVRSQAMAVVIGPGDGGTPWSIENLTLDVVGVDARMNS